MRDSPRTRRLRSDLRAMEQLRDESTIIDFAVPGRIRGDTPEQYLITFRGQGLWRPQGGEDVLVRQEHEVGIQLGTSYPRGMPDMTWRTPVFHPNISSGGVVCLGGYGTHWVPSLRLDELCEMLWDIIRYHNFDVESPYNREAALWVRSQDQLNLPLDDRPLRDRLAGWGPHHDLIRKPPVATQPPSVSEVHFVDPPPQRRVVEAELVQAEIAEPEDPDILFIE